MTDLDELKRLAREATQGEWRIEAFTSVISLRADRGCLIEWLNPSECDESDASFIAAAHPQAVLALIERVEELGREVAMLNEALAEEHAKAEAAYARGLAVHAEEAQRAESERDAYKERVALLEGWSKATTKALTGQETAELRVAWTCEKAREMRARAEAMETSAVSAAAELRHAYRAHGLTHGPIDPNLVERAIGLLEKATTPKGETE